MDMTTLPKVTTSRTTSIPAPGRTDYPVVPERLVRIDGVDYVRCALHGLIPLDHECAKSPGDHWCRTAAHPTYDPATGLDGLDDQAVTHREWDIIQAMKIANWQRVATEAVEALKVADIYLDGFVWITEPEFSELRDIKRASKMAQGRVTALTAGNGLSKKQSDALREGESRPTRRSNVTSREPCSNCDGKGRYTCWPHTTCPICEGTGLSTTSVADSPVPTTDDAIGAETLSER